MTDLKKSREYIMKNYIIISNKQMDDFRMCLIAKDHTSSGKWIKKQFDLIFGEEKK